MIYQRSAGQQGKVEAMQRLAGPVWDLGLYRPGFREFGWGVDEVENLVIRVLLQS